MITCAFRVRITVALTLAVTSILLGWTLEYGWMLRGEIQVEIVEGLKATLGYITYQPGEEISPTTGLWSHDRLFLRLRWDFIIF